MDISNRNIDSTGPRRRLTQDLNKRPPISLATHRRSGTIRTIADHAGSSQNAVYDDDFIAQKYDTQPSTGRRRTVQLNDFINTQTSAGSSSNIDLLYSSNRDFAKTEEQQLLSSQSRNNNLSIPIKPSTSMYDPIYNMSLASTGDLDKARLMEENRELRQREKQYMDKLDRYERQLEELAIKFQQYKDLRTTKQEEVLAEHMTISQMKDDGKSNSLK
ncbi:hypothetical protein BDF20DRAFT_101048 [Mycotypha africana]|uniref:uncharacterized protein n=1 Tax=Mycotypha africana TaxID=64632 RepID=UPI00230145BF|nr:uncharacterized protein BDF20DRAFT_101048 [Mycotypha africana]KAI8970053.1 hypothetical protein BDF20DRAFT_101048 [Mycotypha africana]